MTIPGATAALIVAEVSDPNGTVLPLLDQFWSMWADHAAANPHLQYLYVKRAALDIRLAEEHDSTDIEDYQQATLTRSQIFSHLDEMRRETQAEIVRLEAMSRAGRPAQIGALTTTAPTAPPFSDGPDRNDSRYQGDPYRRPIHFPY